MPLKRKMTRNVQIRLFLSALLAMVSFANALPRWRGLRYGAPYAPRPYSVYESPPSGGYSYAGHGPQPTITSGSDSTSSSRRICMLLLGIDQLETNCRPLSFLEFAHGIWIYFGHEPGIVSGHSFWLQSLDNPSCKSLYVPD